jgi:hypothetical protein
MNKDIMIAAGFSEQVRMVERKRCPSCSEFTGIHPHNSPNDVPPYSGFRDALSYKEYGISGLCQKCQDKTFKEPKDPCEGCDKKDTEFCKEGCPI